MKFNKKKRNVQDLNRDTNVLKNPPTLNDAHIELNNAYIESNELINPPTIKDTLEKSKLYRTYNVCKNHYDNISRSCNKQYDKVSSILYSKRAEINKVVFIITFVLMIYFLLSGLRFSVLAIADGGACPYDATCDSGNCDDEPGSGLPAGSPGDQGVCFSLTSCGGANNCGDGNTVNAYNCQADGVSTAAQCDDFDPSSCAYATGYCSSSCQFTSEGDNDANTCACLGDDWIAAGTGGQNSKCCGDDTTSDDFASGSNGAVGCCNGALLSDDNHCNGGTGYYFWQVDGTYCNLTTYDSGSTSGTTISGDDVVCECAAGGADGSAPNICDGTVDSSASATGVCVDNDGDGAGTTFSCDTGEICDDGTYFADDCDDCATGVACDSNVLSGGTTPTYSQDGVCVSGGSCDTGDVCINSGTYYGAMSSCATDDECDVDVAPGYSRDGTVTGDDNCCSSGQGEVSYGASKTDTDPDDSCSASPTLGRTCDNSPDAGIALEGVVTTADDCCTGATYFAFGSSATDSTQWENCGTTCTAGRTCYDIGSVSGGFADSEAGLCVSGNSCETGDVCYSGSTYYSTMSSCATDSACDSDITTSGYSRDGTITGDDNCCSGSQGEVAFGSSKTDTDPDDSCSATPTLGRTCDNSPNSGVALEGITTTADDCCTGSTYFAFGTSATDSSPWENCGTSCTDGRTCYDIGNIASGLADSEAGICTGSTVCTTGVVSKNGGDYIASCSSNYECDSDVTTSGYSRTGYCLSGTCTADGSVSEGGSCSHDTQCSDATYSRSCFSGYNNLCQGTASASSGQCRRVDGQACTTGNECGSGVCTGGTCDAASGANCGSPGCGTQCSSDANAWNTGDGQFDGPTNSGCSVSMPLTAYVANFGSCTSAGSGDNRDADCVANCDSGLVYIDSSATGYAYPYSYGRCSALISHGSSCCQAIGGGGGGNSGSDCASGLNCFSGTCLYVDGGACTTGDQCGSDTCIEGTCRAACTSTYDGDRCSDDSNAYTASASGICARTSGGSWSCDKNEVSYYSSDYYTDCDQSSGDGEACDSDVAPSYSQDGQCASGTCCTGETVTSASECDCDDNDVTSEKQCDNTVTSGAYSADGICANDGVGTADSDANCITSGEICIDSANGNRYTSGGSYCIDLDACDKSLTSANYVQDGIICSGSCIGSASSDCCSDSDCSSGEYCSGSYVCTACSSDVCDTEPVCRDGTAGCCDADSDCPALKSCDTSSSSSTRYQCDTCWTLTRGTFDGTQRNSGNPASGDMCYNINMASATDACLIYNIYDTEDEDTDAKIYIAKSFFSNTVASGNNNWAYFKHHDTSSDLSVGDNLIEFDDNECCWQLDEVMVGYEISEAGATDASSSTSCCDASTDCVDDWELGSYGTSGSWGCYNTATLRDTGGGDGADTEECRSGTWYAQDADSTACGNAGNTWLSSGTGSYSDCCGDDSGEDFEQASAAGRSCCYNAAVLADDGESSSILCENGQLYDCGSQVSVTGNVDTESSDCANVGNNYCDTDTNTWIDTIPTGCSCTTGSSCEEGYCIEGTCRAACTSTYDGDRCSDDGNAYTDSASGICARSSAGAWSCDKGEVSYYSSDYYTDCDQSSGDGEACDSDVAPSYSQDGQCAAANCCTDETVNSAAECDCDDNDVTSEIQCDNTVTSGAYSADGICANDGVGTADSDANCITSGEICIDSAASNRYTQTCDYCASGDDCDSSLGSANYVQDGVCVSDGGTVCDTGDVCNATATYYGSMSSCSTDDGCDTDVAPGYTRDGTVTGDDNCCSSTDGEVAYGASKTDTDPDDSCSTTPTVGMTCDNVPDGGIALEGVVTTADDCCTGATYFAFGSGSVDLTPWENCGTTCTHGRTCYDIGNVASGFADSEAGLCVNEGSCETGDVCYTGSIYYSTMSSCSTDDACDSDISTAGYSRDGTLTGDDNCCSSTDGEVAYGSNKTDTDPDDSCSSSPTLGRTCDNSPDAGVALEGITTTADDCCTGATYFAFGTSATDSTPYENCGTTCTAGRTCYDIGNVASGFADSEAGLCVNEGSCEVGDVCYTGSIYYSTMGSCSEGNACDSDITTSGYSADGVVFNNDGSNLCCNAGEDYEHSEASGACCYNNAILSDGSSSSSVLCEEGLLYDCGSQITASPDADTNSADCANVGSSYCDTSTNTWVAGIPDGCSCTTGSSCLGGYCIEAVCASACNSTYDGDRCSDDGTAYDNSASGVCARNSEGTWSCDKDEVSFYSSDYYTDCDQSSGDGEACDSDVAPSYSQDGQCAAASCCTDETVTSASECDCDDNDVTSEKQCDNSVTSGAYSADGICANDGVGTADSDANCITSGEICIDSAASNRYTQTCDYCANADACDSSLGSADYVQDGVCVADGGVTCDTVDVCNSTSTLYGTMSSCATDDGCDYDVAPGYTRSGTVTGDDNCCASGQGEVAYGASKTDTDPDDSCSTTPTVGMTCDNVPDGGIALEGVVTTADDCCTGATYFAFGSGSVDLTPWENCGTTCTHGRTCYDIGDISGGLSDAEAGLCVNEGSCSTGVVCYTGSIYYSTMSSCSTDDQCDSDITTAGYTRDGTLTGDDNCCSDSEGETAFGASKTDTDPDDSCSSSPTVGRTCDNDPLNGITLEGIVTTADDCCTNATNFTFGSSATDSTPWENCGPTCTAGRTCYDIGDVTSGFADSEAGLCVNEGSCDTVDVCYTGAVYYGTMSSCSTDDACDSDISTAGYSRDGTITGDDNCCSSTDGEVAYGASKTDTDPDDSCAASPTLGMTCDNSPDAGIALEGITTTGDNCCTGATYFAFGTSATDSSPYENCGTTCTAGRTCYDIGDVSSGFADAEAGLCVNEGSCEVGDVCYTGSIYYSTMGSCSEGNACDSDITTSGYSADGVVFNNDGTSLCCDGGEDYEHSEASGACCYNNAILSDGSSSSSVLCEEGLLYDCGSQITASPDADTNDADCQQRGSKYCDTDTNTWIATIPTDCSGCSAGTDCEDGLCVDGTCRSSCASYPGYGCSADGTAYNHASSGGVCLSAGTCDQTDPVVMDCGATCTVGSDSTYASCNSTSGDSCDSETGGGNFAQAGLCADSTGASCITSGFVIDDGSNYQASADADGSAEGDDCDDSLTNGDFTDAGNYDPDDGVCDDCSSVIGEDGNCEFACGGNTTADEKAASACDSTSGFINASCIYFNDGDSNETVCDCIKGSSPSYWNIGGETSASSCCEDASENRVVSTFDAGTMDASADGTDACCLASTDCVDANTCYDNADVSTDADSDGDNDYCNSATWYDCNTASECPEGYSCVSNDCVDDLPPSCSLNTITEGLNNEYQYVSGSTIYYTTLSTGSFNVTITATDPGSGIRNVTFPATVSAGGIDTSNPYIYDYQWATDDTYDQLAVVICYDLDDNTNATNFTVNRDVAAPSGGSLSYDDGFYASASVALTFSDGTDSESGLNSSNTRLLRRSATLTGGSCGGYGSWSQLGGLDPSSVYNDATVEDGNCYQYRYEVHDNILNGVNYTSASTAMIDITKPACLVTGLTEGLNNEYQYVSGTTIYYNTLTTGSFNVTVDANHSVAGIRNVTYPATVSAGGIDATDPYIYDYQWATDDTYDTTGTVTCYATSGQSNTSTFTVNRDVTAPSGGSISYADGYTSAGSITFSDGTDSESGLNASNTRLLRRTAAMLDNNTCDSYGAWAQVGSLNPTSPYTDGSTAGGNCYQYRYEVHDNVLNGVNYTDADTIKINNISTHDTPSLTPALPNTTSNLTCAPQNVADLNSDPVTNITNWYKDNQSLTLLYMPFEGTGNEQTNATDYSGYNNNGTVLGAEFNRTGGKVGGAYQFDGSDDYINCGTNDVFNVGTGGHTFEAWAYPTEMQTDEYHYITAIGNTASGKQSGIGFRNNGIFHSAYSAPIIYSTYTIPSLETWYHIVVVHNSGTDYLYVNGDFKESQNIVINTNAGKCSVGSHIGYTSYFNGTLDEVRIYNHSLTSDQIYQNYLAGSVGRTPNVILYNETALNDEWHCEVTPNDGYQNGINKNSTHVTVANAPPTISTQTFNPDPANTLSNIQCKATPDDAENTTLAVEYWWYNATDLMLYGNNTELTAGNNAVINTLGSGNTTTGETWNCTLRAYDGTDYSEYISSTIYINNTAPYKPTLIHPAEGNSTFHDRTPFFDWNTSDPDGDTLNYTINVTFTSAIDCGADITTNVTTENYTAAYDYCVDHMIYWKVRAFDGAEYSDWSDEWNFTIESYISLELTTATVDFGDMDVLAVETTDSDASPLILENTGNILINISRISANASLWVRQALNTQFFQFKADDDSTESGSFNTSASTMSWSNFTSVTSLNKSLIEDLDYNDSNDNAEIDIRVQVPLDEPPGSKKAAIYIVGERS